jgi:hypothetical protein
MPSTSKTYNFTTNHCYNRQSVQYTLPFNFELDETEQYIELTEHPFNQNIEYNSFNKATKCYSKMLALKQILVLL